MSAPAPTSTSTQDRAPLLLASTWIWTSLAIIFVSLRFYCRAIIVRKVWWDDWMILASVCFTFTFSVIWTVYAHHGGCRHLDTLTLEQIIETTRLNWISQPMCVGGLTTGKISVACLIYRLQSPTRWRTQLLIGLCSLMCVINTTVVILMFTQCVPVSLLWDIGPNAPKGHCIKSDVVSILSQSASSYMAFLDLVLAAIPVHMIWQLQMDLKKKLAICGLLSTGVTAFAFAVVKIIELGNDSNHADITWATVLLFVWNAFEINIVIIAACIPAMVPIFEIISGRKKLSHYAEHTGGKYYAPNSFHMKDRSARLESRNSDTESATNILASKNTANVFTSSEADVRQQSLAGEKGKITMTKQWSVGVNAPQ